MICYVAPLPFEFCQNQSIPCVNKVASSLLKVEKSLRHPKKDNKNRPMKNEGATLIISIGNYWFSYKKKSYNYGLEGGCTVKFNFDSSQNNFALTKIDLWGI